MRLEVLGLLLLCTFGFMLCGFAAIRQNIQDAVGCVRVSVECVFSMPTMMLTPIFEAARGFGEGGGGGGGGGAVR